MTLRLIAHETVPPEGYTLTPAPHDRDWMSATHERTAYRCLPMLIANQSGWLIRNPQPVRFKWDGGPLLSAIEIQRREFVPVPPDYCFPMSHFGVGIITWTLPYLFRTEPGYNLLVRGPANHVKDGITALEGVVETDWTAATFTMNWKITRPDTWITFDQGEPLAMIVPQRRGELEEFSPQVRPLAEDPELKAANAAWCESRDRSNVATAAGSGDWEKHYFQGRSPDGGQASEHQTKLRLQEFT